MSNDLDKMLAELFSDEKSDDDNNDNKLSLSAQKALLEGVQTVKIDEQYKVGAYVERNKYGKKRYLFPKEGEMAMITAIFPVTIEHGNGPGNMVDAEVTCCRFINGKTIMVAATVNLKYFKVVSHSPKESDDDED